MNILIEGWRGINHSYALVNQWQIKELIKSNNITPKSIVKEVRDITEKLKENNLEQSGDEFKIENISDKNINKLIKDLEKEMKNSAKILEFEKAALLRDQITELRKNLINGKG